MDLVAVNGVRIVLDDGSWSSCARPRTPPNLVVCESFASAAEMRAIFGALDGVIRDQTI